MLDMVVDVEMPPNHLGNPHGSPQIVGPTMRLSASKQQAFQLRVLLEAQQTLGAGMAFGGQSARCQPLEFDLAINGVGRNAQHSCDGGLCVAAFDRFDSLAATAFKFFSTSDRSHA